LSVKVQLSVSSRVSQRCRKVCSKDGLSESFVRKTISSKALFERRFVRKLCSKDDLFESFVRKTVCPKALFERRFLRKLCSKDDLFESFVRKTICSKALFESFATNTKRLFSSQIILSTYAPRICKHNKNAHNVALFIMILKTLHLCGDSNPRSSILEACSMTTVQRRFIKQKLCFQTGNA
jgi:hypothetical protein